jgi:hypothetical protein
MPGHDRRLSAIRTGKNIPSSGPSLRVGYWPAGCQFVLISPAMVKPYAMGAFALCAALPVAGPGCALGCWAHEVVAQLMLDDHRGHGVALGYLFQFLLRRRLRWALNLNKDPGRGAPRRGSNQPRRGQSAGSRPIPFRGLSR